MSTLYSKLNGEAYNPWVGRGNYGVSTEPNEVAEKGKYTLEEMIAAPKAIQASIGEGVTLFSYEIQPSLISQQLFDLGDEGYNLNHPIQLIMNIYPDEVWADWAEADIQGRGESEHAAIEDLRKEILDAYDDLSATSDDELGGELPTLKRLLLGCIQKI